jgi:hypothetical protein
MKLRLYLIFLALLLAGLPANGQSTFATITGSVTDPSGAVLANAKVEAIEVTRNYRFSVTTNAEGVYTIANLPDGTYNIVAQASGFQEFRAENILLAARDNRRVDIQMSIGSVGQTVEVTGGATLIETDTARLANTMNREVMRALPLTLRRAWDYFTMTPQVERTAAFHIRIAGSGNNQSDATIDGTSIAGAFSSAVGPLLDRTELVQEMRIDVALGSAEQATLGQVTLTSRAGTNDFHGTLADYYNTPRFRARNPFNNVRSSGRSHQMIFSAGGPVYIPKIYNGRNKTFFFHTTEIAFGSQRNTQINRTVPLAAWREGNFSALSTPIIDPQTRSPFPGNIIPSSRINPTSRAYQDRFIIAPNFGDAGTFATNNFRVTRLYPFVHQPTITTRLDHRISDKQFIFGRITNVRWNFYDPDTNLPTITEQVLNYRHMDTMTLAHTYTIRPTILNEFRFGWTGERNPTKSPLRGNQLAQELGLRGLATGIPDDVTGILRVRWQNLGLSELTTRIDCDPCSTNSVFNYIDNITIFRGGHTFKLGTNIRYSTNRDLRQPEALFGRSTFSNRFTGHTYADFLLGLPSEMERAFPTVENYRTRMTHGYYFTDEWKIRQNLTLTLGLRWDAQLPWREANGRISMFDINTGRIVVPDGTLDKVSPLMPRGYIDIVEASSAGYDSKTLIKPDLNNWQPRIGFAYRPWGNNTVIRGGFGIAYNQVPRGLTTVGVPFVIGEPAFVNPTDNPLTWPTVFPAAGSGGPSTVSIPSGSIANLQIARVMQQVFTIEHQRWDWGFSVNYTGTGTRHGVYTRNINQPVADERLFVDKPRAFPRYPDISLAENGAGHQYHAATVQALRRYKNGLHAQLYYTFARDIGDLEDGQSPEDAYNRRRERAVWERQATHRFSSNVMYDLPFGKGRPFMSNANKFVNAVFGGWQLSAIVAFESGRWFTPLWQGPDPTGTRFTQGRTRPVVTLRPDQIRDSRLDKPTVDRWYDVGAYDAPDLGQFGTSAKNTILGPGTQVMHNSVAKYFVFRERVRLRLEFLATNTLNHPNYADPSDAARTITSAGAAGVITNVIDRNAKFDTAIPREIQAQLRLEW